MKILFLPIFLSSWLLAQDDAKPGDPVGGYDTTIYNPSYSEGFLGPKANPEEQLRAIYPQSQMENAQVDNRTLGSDFSAAKAQAVYWLSLLDQQAYSASWRQAGGLLQDLVPNNTWTAAMKSIRGNLGNNTSRSVASHNTSSRLPHGTKGTFMTITFNSSFTAKTSVKEKVILMAEGGQSGWKVISYSIQ